MMRPVELLGTILALGYHAEMREASHGSLLTVKPRHPLSRAAGQIINNEGFKFSYSFSEEDGRSVLIFYKNSFSKSAP